MSAAPGERDMPGDVGGRAGGRRQKHSEKMKEELKDMTEEDASYIVAEAYKEANRIIEEARKKAADINTGVNNTGQVKGMYAGILERADNAGEVYEQLDEIFMQIRLQLQTAGIENRLVVERLLELINQLEYHVDTLVVDSLKLRNVRNWLKDTTDLARRLRARLDG